MITQRSTTGSLRNSAIVYGTALGTIQLNATASVIVNGTSTLVTVRAGEAEVAGGGHSVIVHSGQTLRLMGMDQVSVDVIEAQKPENGTSLRWEPAPGKVDHYEVLWRETTVSDWQYVQDVPPQPAGEAITVTLPISKDNVIFAVRAVDAAGHRGLAVAPEPPAR